MTTAPAAAETAPAERTIPHGAYPFGAFAAQSVLGVRPSTPTGRSGSA